MTERDSMTAESADDPWIGRVLTGRYRVVAKIGGGGMGVVYRAWDSHADGYAVIKVPRQELTGDPKFLMRFEQELTALQLLSHPTVVPIVDVGSEQGMPFAVMPYLAGGSLKQRRPITKGGASAPADPTTLWQWLPAIACAVDFVHANGYVHRDVKPDNILFDGPGAPYLSDFGVAKVVLQSEDAESSRGLTGTGFTLGTPEYMAPELISAAQPGPLVDQYALAVMTYEMLAGRRPFDGPTPAAVLVAHATTAAPALADMRKSIPQGVSDAVARGMAKNPVERFESCESFAHQLLSAVPRPQPTETLQLMCPQCGRMLNVKPDWAGKHGSCPRCKMALKIGGDLRSLWIPGDRTGSITPTESIYAGSQFEGTPSVPMRVDVGWAPKRTDSARQRTPQLTAVAVLKELFGKSVVVHFLAATVVAIAVLGVAMTLLQAGKRPRVVVAKAEPRRLPSQSIKTTKSDLVASAPAGSGEPKPTAHASIKEGIATLSPPEPGPLAESIPHVQRDERPSVESDAPPIPGAKAAGFGEQERGGEDQRRLRRLPVPPAEDIEDALKHIRRTYDQLYSQAAKQQVFGFLVDQLSEAAGRAASPVERYALLVEAQKLCVPGLMLDRAVELAQERSRLFEDDANAAELAIFERFAEIDSHGNEAAFFAAMEAMELAKKRMNQDRYDVADGAAALAGNLARAVDLALKDGEARKRLKAAEGIQAQVRDAKRIFDAFVAAQKTVEASPEDEAAHAAIGRHLCFSKRSWEKGLDHLVRGGLGTLSEVASRQKQVDAGDKMDSQSLFDVAEQWWALTEAEDGKLSLADREAIKRFSIRQYQRYCERIRGFGAEGFKTTTSDFKTKASVRTALKRINEVPSEDGIGERLPFAGRTDWALQRRLVATDGGTPQSQVAVEAALEWLSEHQMPDGGWAFDLGQCPNCKGQCAHSGVRGDRCGATALVLLPFLGRGYTHTEGPYKRQVLNGLNYLAGVTVKGNGMAYRGDGGNMYSQGLVGIALSEAYALTQDKRLALPAQLALNYIREAQDVNGGGWRYWPKQPGDTSALGWQLTALKSGDMARLQVSPLTIKKAERFLDRVERDQGSAYGYEHRGDGGPCTSAVGLLCRMYMGWKRDNPALQRGAAQLEMAGPSTDLYFDYYATQVLRQLGGSHWVAWNNKMRDMLVNIQATQGHEKGSWHEGVDGGHGPHAGGRIYCTAMATLILEVYYRHQSFFSD